MSAKITKAISDAQKQAGGQPTTPKTYTVRGLWDLVKIDLPPLDYLWNGIALMPGSVVEIIGSPGIGKSRFVGDLARR